MTSAAVQRDIGHLITGSLARLPETITAAAGNDNANVNGPAINRLAQQSRYLSCAALQLINTAHDK